MIRLALALLTATSALGLFGAPNPTGADPPERLDLSGYRIVFEDEFDTLSVTARGPGSRWIAHTPFAKDFGEAPFADPEPGFPFTVENGTLRIEASKSAGQWQAGLLSSVDARGNGFSQQYGYFEIRAKLPRGPGVWPAFWLVENQPDFWTGEPGAKSTSVEIDVFEFYGRSPGNYEATIHVWSKAFAKDRITHQFRIRVPTDSLGADFHTYGVRIESDETVFFFDRTEVARAPTPPELQRPLLVMVNLALGGGWSIERTPNPSHLFVDYVRVYAR